MCLYLSLNRGPIQLIVLPTIEESVQSWGNKIYQFATDRINLARISVELIVQEPLEEIIRDLF